MTTLTYWLIYPIMEKYLFIEPFLGNPRIWEIPTQEMVEYYEEYDDDDD